MGYYIQNIGSTMLVYEEHEKKILDAVNAVFTTQHSSFKNAVKDHGFEPYLLGGAWHGWDYQDREWHRDLERFFLTIAPWVRPGGEIIFVGEQSEVFGYVFDGQRCAVVGGVCQLNLPEEQDWLTKESINYGDIT